MDGVNGILKLRMSQGGGQVFVCTNSYCRGKGSDTTMASFKFLTPHNIPIQSVNCLGRCNKGPNCRLLTPSGAFVDVRTRTTFYNIWSILK